MVKYFKKFYMNVLEIIAFILLLIEIDFTTISVTQIIILIVATVVTILNVITFILKIGRK